MSSTGRHTAKHAMGKPRVVIVGGGFAGAALAKDKKLNAVADVTLIDPKARLRPAAPRGPATGAAVRGCALHFWTDCSYVGAQTLACKLKHMAPRERHLSCIARPALAQEYFEVCETCSTASNCQPRPVPAGASPTCHAQPPARHWQPRPAAAAPPPDYPSGGCGSAASRHTGGRPCSTSRSPRRR